jgi:RNA polymerase sigma-70 factor (ECF subfamily)
MKLALAEDAELVQLAQAGENVALRELFSRHDGAAFQVALNMLYDDYHNASEAVQMARIQCWKVIGKATPLCFKDWYLGIVRHACQRIYHQQHRTGCWMGLLDDVEPLLVSPLQQIVEREARSYLQGLVDGLPELQRRCVKMKYFGGYTYPEIAEELHITKNYARVSVQRGLTLLRSRLNQ